MDNLKKASSVSIITLEGLAIMDVVLNGQNTLSLSLNNLKGGVYLVVAKDKTGKPVYKSLIEKIE